VPLAVLLAVELARLIAGGRDTAIPALAEAPDAPDGWTLLPRIVARMDDPDRDIAAAAARSAARLARQTAPRADELGVPADELAESAATCARVARAKERRADLRVHALECAVALGRDELALELVTDADAEVRLAAVELADPEAAHAALLARVEGDDDPRVVLAAAVAACRVAKLPAAGKARAARLRKDPRVDRGDAAAFLRCR
jgi:hypothetical protein